MKRLTSVILCAVLLFASVAYIEPPTVAHAATRQELEDQIDKLDDEIRQNQSQLNDLANKKQSQEKYLDTLESQIAAVEKKVDALETQINVIDNEISEYDKQLKQLNNEISVIEDEINAAAEQIEKTQQDIKQSEDLLSMKIRSSYVNGNETTLKILMGSDSLAGFLTSLEMMKRIAEDDKKVIENFKQQVETLNQATNHADRTAKSEETYGK